MNIESVIGWIVGRSWLPPQDFDVWNWVTSVFVVAMAGVILLELVFPRERRSFARRNVTTAAYFVFSAKIAFIAAYGPTLERLWFDAGWPSLRLDTVLSGLPYAVVGLLVITFGDYWSHRFMHVSSWGWHIHKIHHAPTHLNWATRYHLHWLMPAVDVPIVTVLSCLTGAHLVAPFGTLVIVADLFAHANTRLTFGWLNYLFVTPDTHAYHHANERRFYHVNFGNVILLWDHLFGTFVYDKHYRPTRFGIDEPIPEGFIGQQVAPMLAMASDLRQKVRGNVRAIVRAWVLVASLVCLYYIEELPSPFNLALGLTMLLAAYDTGPWRVRDGR